jgi:hypothetical protein
MALYTKQSHVHCEEAIDGAAVDLPLHSSENSGCWHSQINGSMLHLC